ncbi:MAG: hypothetical protein KJ052_19455 [Candidatus Hydrogenedentes bacterium]|nr:hypothetical protein [Candidatus Hydrogenedentota bacterium]
MIEILLTTGLALYSSLLFGIAFVIWITTEISVQRSRHFLEKQYMWRCGICGYIYLDDSGESISRCPRCESYNSAADSHTRFVTVATGAEELEHAHGDAEEDRRKNPSRRKRRGARRGPRKRGGRR